jgi:AhpD family alkylhydroperoxidase
VLCADRQEEWPVSYGKTVREELRVPTRELRHAIPQVYAGYKQLHDSALAPGALDARTKELIALAIAVSKECDGCIAAHAHAAVQHGASPQEAAEAIGRAFPHPQPGTRPAPGLGAIPAGGADHPGAGVQRLPCRPLRVIGESGAGDERPFLVYAARPYI